MIDHTEYIDLIEELSKVLMIQLGILGTLKDPVGHGTLARTVHRQRCVDGVIDRTRCISALEGAVGQIIVPGDHGHSSVFLIEIIIMDHHTGIAVAIDREVMDDKIAQGCIDIDNAVDIGAAAEDLQRIDQALFILFGDIGLGLVKDIGIARCVLTVILQLDIARTHAKAAEASHIGAFVFAILTCAAFPSAGHLTHVAKAAHIAKVTHIGHLRKVKIAHVGHL